MIDRLLDNPYTLIALILMVCATAGLVVLRRRSATVQRALWATLAAGIALILYAALSPQPPEAPKEQLTGSISVPAYSAAGTAFQNYMRFPVTMEFVAAGQWSLTALPGSITGPAGTGETADARYTLPGAPVGGLILQRVETGAYEYIGARGTLEFGPEERILLLMNDFKAENAYADNTGILKLLWTCFNCIP
jgi:hypothetical protein